ncbi:hypothetical protein BJP34_07870 [Moorena producens PAL-8-15-08-1]|uniref:GPI inositol-deacylase PGAP1-like alpha/beta domain-containing protein n=1 Tax=Moorena producens PAL-8-15-08-1 TaxID=1458985 RepID=A0A1D8TP56_9CYAN|nr:hypothetical protein [Moorena producens]AOW99383.1 hypothetical protein BJP34_07870 [Moorena producens PAL-8-15-08-1]
MSVPTRTPLPIILIRGFGGLNIQEEQRLTYQGFNQGTVYEHKKGTNEIYEGLILSFLKSDWQYQDATNVVTFSSQEIEDEPALPRKLNSLQKMLQDGKPLPSSLQWLKDNGIFDKFKRLKEETYTLNYPDKTEQKRYFSGDKVVINPEMSEYFLESIKEPWRSIWVFRYYDLKERKFDTYGNALVRLIYLIRELTANQAGVKPKVNIIAHSMGGLIAREAVQVTYPSLGLKAEDYINKIITLGTPHQGITFQILEDWLGFGGELGAQEELERFNLKNQSKLNNPYSFQNFEKHFPLERLLTIVGTNYKSYNFRQASFLNRVFSPRYEFGSNYNRSDGLVKQFSAQIPGAPRTFIHKSHGGFDSVITSREAFEVATRFLFGNVRSRLRFVKGQITRGKDWFGKSEFFLGVSIKPRLVDFELFHQSEAAENCYGPFIKEDLTDENPAFTWADGKNLIWEGYLNTISILEDESIPAQEKDMVLRLDFYVGERDLLGLGFSDNVIFRKQYYIQVLIAKTPIELYLHTDEKFAQPDFTVNPADKMKEVDGAWEFQVQDTGFEGTFQIEIDSIPEDGHPEPFLSGIR